MKKLQRKTERVRYEDGVVIYKALAGTNRQGFLQNISQSGAYLRSEDDLPVKKEVIFYIPIRTKAKNTLCIVSGEIVRKGRHARGLTYGYGVRFGSDISVTSKQLITEFVYFKLGKNPESESNDKRKSVDVSFQPTDKIGRAMKNDPKPVGASNTKNVSKRLSTMRAGQRLMYLRKG